MLIVLLKKNISYFYNYFPDYKRSLDQLESRNLQLSIAREKIDETEGKNHYERRKLKNLRDVLILALVLTILFIHNQPSYEYFLATCSFCCVLLYVGTYNLIPRDQGKVPNIFQIQQLWSKTDHQNWYLLNHTRIH